MSRDLKEVIQALKESEGDLKQNFIWYKEQEENAPGTNILYYGLEGIISQNDLTTTTWNMGADSGSVKCYFPILMDPWGKENRLRMICPMGEWVRMDKLLRSLGISIHPPMHPWELITISFMLSYMNGFHLIYPWGNFIQVQMMTKPVFTRHALERTEHEMTISVRLKSSVNRKAGEAVNMVFYPAQRFLPDFGYYISGSYYPSSIGKRFVSQWNKYCVAKGKPFQQCDGVLFTNRNGDIIAAGGDNVEDVAVVFEKEKRIISPGKSDGNLPGSTMVTFFLIGEANHYKVENRPITLSDLKKSDWGVVTEAATFLRWNAVVDTQREENIPVSKKNISSFGKFFLENYITLKHRKTSPLGLPKLIEKGEEWFPDPNVRKELALKGLKMKKQCTSVEGWKNVVNSPPEGELKFKKQRLRIANMYGKYWRLPSARVVFSQPVSGKPE